MTLAVSSALEDAAWAAARAEVGGERLAEAALARAVIDRSERYTSARDQLAQPADRIGDLAARATFFTVADAMKIAVPLRELAHAGALPAATPLRIVDVGAGCGAMQLGAIAQLAELARPLAIVAIDRDAAALRIGAAAVRAFAAARGATVQIDTRTDNATRAALPPADLIIFGNVLNELPPAHHAALISRALAAIAPDGAVIIIEPALRETARALHTVRDTMLAAGAHVVAPCTRALAPCPMLADERDWCHEDRPVTLPPRTAALARRTHLRDGGLRFAYLVVRRTPAHLVDDPRAWRIVSAPMAQKGKLELYGCSDRGRVRLRLLRRNRSDSNRAFERADRGDVVIVAPPTDDLAADTAVELVPIAGDDSPAV